MAKSLDKWFNVKFSNFNIQYCFRNLRQQIKPMCKLEFMVFVKIALRNAVGKGAYFAEAADCKTFLDVQMSSNTIRYKTDLFEVEELKLNGKDGSISNMTLSGAPASSWS